MQLGSNTASSIIVSISAQIQDKQKSLDLYSTSELVTQEGIKNINKGFPLSVHDLLSIKRISLH